MAFRLDGSNDTVEHLAGRLRSAYVRERRRHTSKMKGRNTPFGEDRLPARIDGGLDGNGRRHKSVWCNIAGILLNHGVVDPERFVAAQFQGKACPEPNMLTGTRAWERYEERSLHGPGQADLEAKSYVAAFAVASHRTRAWFPEMTDNEIWRYVICDLQLPLSALFRYCVAANAGFMDLAEEWQQQALDEYMTDPVSYQKAWGERIPLVLTQASEQLLAPHRGRH